MADKLKMGDLYRIDIFTSFSEDRVEIILNSLKYTSTFCFIASYRVWIVICIIFSLGNQL